MWVRFSVLAMGSIFGVAFAQAPAARRVLVQKARISIRPEDKRYFFHICQHPHVRASLLQVDLCFIGVQ
jgi:hypothetical protein